ncbi:MAG: hypothetical protein A2679_03625 [Candidatus Sungbacteria bacterium RIFCSPHIGHO2_01_FULL_54_26]|nr:MAG: hypothetical protein A2679_03625 [Candidatus Sungbacteria bacterium RIFCSPHIGHO2_01_FULL_54_26]
MYLDRIVPVRRIGKQAEHRIGQITIVAFYVPQANRARSSAPQEMPYRLKKGRKSHNLFLYAYREGPQ